MTTGLRDWLMAAWHRAVFQPPMLAVLVNPIYIVRRGLFLGIRRHAHLLSGQILDFGCGSKPYRNLFPSADYVGLDVPAGGHPAADKTPDVWYDGGTIPFRDACFDGVFSSEVFEHLFDPNGILTELHRVLKPQGWLLITTPFVWDEHEIPHDFARYTSYGLRYLLERRGFEIIDYCKTTGYLETVAQMASAYLGQIRPIRRNPVLLGIVTLLFCVPLNLLGMTLNLILPRDDRFFHNSVVLARKAG